MIKLSIFSFREDVELSPVYGSLFLVLGMMLNHHLSIFSFREDVESSPVYGNKPLVSLSRPATSASTKKKKQKIPRPYTPHYLNIIDEVKENTGPR